MSLKDKIESKLQIALKSKQKKEITTLRLILAGIKDKEIEIRGSDKKKELADDDIINLLKKMVKQRTESIELYKKSGREDLFNSEMEEVKIVESFMPNQLSEDEIKKICQGVVKSIGASSLKDMGKIMGVLKSKHAQEIDFSKAGKIIKEMLK